MIHTGTYWNFLERNARRARSVHPQRRGHGRGPVPQQGGGGGARCAGARGRRRLRLTLTRAGGLP